MQAGLKAILFGSPFYPGAIVALDFVANRYRAASTSGYAGSFTSLPGLSITRASIGYAQDASGNLVSFASGVARITNLGLLVEESRTNLLLWSQALDNAAWTKTNATITADAVSAPDGSLTADKLAEAAGTGEHKAYQGVGASTGSYTWTVYAKAAERSWIVLDTPDAETDAYTYFDIANGAVGTTASGATATIEAVSNGWYRCRVTRSITSGNRYVQVGVTTGNGVASYAGASGSGAYIWGAQIEQASFPSSYIPTTSASATRAADQITLTGSWPISALTLVVKEQLATWQSSVSSTPIMLVGSDGTKFIREFIDNTLGAGATKAAVNGDGITATDIGSTLASGATVGIAASVNAGAVHTSTNGSAAVTLTGSSTLGNLTTLYLGEGGAGTGQLNGYLTKVLVYPVAFSDAQLQAASQ